MKRRGFDTLEAMHAEMVAQWNAKISPEDTVYHLGDLSFGSVEETAALLLQLHGIIRLVPGNHDLHKDRKWLRQLLGELERVSTGGHGQCKLVPCERLHTVKVKHNAGPLRLELCHYPVLIWDRGHYGALQLHGHCHGQAIYPDVGTTRMDVGVDAVGYAPLSLAEVLTAMEHLSYVPHDYHRPKGAAPAELIS
jgi:calcineurin-like phosphoesterase family protein